VTRSRRKPGAAREPGAATDWAAVREGIRRAQLATESTLDLSPERARSVMDERARLLARPPAPEPAPGEVLELLTFTLARERYAVEARYVRQILRITQLTPVPGAPEFIAGIVHVRGEIVAVIELGRFFGLPPRGVTDLSRLLVLGQERDELGILADTADEMAAVRAGEILDASGTVTGIGREHLRGVTRQALIVLDAAALLRDERLFVGLNEPLSKGNSRNDE
jgi:purine-binding chemotaxis protein CheW